MAGVMFTIAAPEGPPTLSEAAQKLHVAEQDLDKSFGVVMIDPRRHLYTVLVDEKAAGRAYPKDGSVEGPYANPRIGTYGPVTSRDGH